MFTEALSISSVIKIVFEHQFPNVIKFFVILHNQKIAAMTSRKSIVFK